MLLERESMICYLWRVGKIYTDRFLLFISSLDYVQYFRRDP